MGDQTMKPLDVEEQKAPVVQRGFFAQLFHQLKNDGITQLRVTAFVIIFLLILFFILGMVYGSQRSKDLETFSGLPDMNFSSMCTLVDFLPACFPAANPDHSPINFKIRFTTLDPGVGGAGGFASLSVRLSFPQSLFRNREGTFPNRARNQLHVQLGDNILTFAPNDVVNLDQTARLPLNSGSLTYYPFDEYKLDLSLEAAIVSNPLNGSFAGLPQFYFSISNQDVVLGNPDGTLSPFRFLVPGLLPNGTTFNGSLYDFANLANAPVSPIYSETLLLPHTVTISDTTAGPFELTASMIPPQGAAFGVLKFRFARPAVSKIYPLCVVIGMWGILIAELYVLYWMTVIRYKKTDNPAMLGFFAAVIFALPSLRNSMPFNPPMGILIDFAAFFWAEIIAMAALLIISIRFAFDTHPHIQPNAAPPPPPK
eukprot:TRINITY_DN7808_c0_g1_i8.p1 TRINITY_DN7808_c0_g1~~TRINITY_DN7808_c0_g1_i8.p1  ORF type:complete len:436 (+),score=86.64 TRINITY_DN7808_c0_g1_i8:33-1310(+)